MTKMVTILVEVLIFTSLIGIIAGLVTDAVVNLSGASAVMVGLVTLFVVIGFIMMILKKTGVSSK